MKDLDIIFACEDAGVHVNGAAVGAYKLYENTSGNKKIVKQKEIIKSYDVKDHAKNLNEVNEFNTSLYNEVYSSLCNNHKVLTIGGDHSIAIASALASIKFQNKMGVIWVDAHGDYNTFDTTITGNLHGLPLAVIDGYEKRHLSEFHNGNYVEPKNTVIIGGRDFDDLEKVNLKNAGVTIFGVDDIRKYGVKEIVNRAIKIASDGEIPVHVSYDIDVIDPKLAPGVSVPAVDGINLEEAANIMEELLCNNKIINSIDIVEYNSLTDKENVTFNTAVQLINKVINNL